jgi:hypothetical protein
MSALDYTVELEVECPDNDPNDPAFIQVTTTIRVRDAVEEFVACKMFLLASVFGFKDVTISMTPVSKVQTVLPLFSIESVSTEDTTRILAEVETEAERFLGWFRPREYNALMTVKLLNRGHLNHVFEQIGWLPSLARFPAVRPLKRQGTSEKLKCQRNRLQKG